MGGVKGVIVREALLGLLRCAYCGEGLRLGEVTVWQEDEVWVGELVCAGCAVRFAVWEGMAFVHRRDASWEAKEQEAQGWVALHKQQGNYEPSEEGVDLQIPYYREEPWVGVAKRFDQALAWLQLTGSERVLDLGAGRGWAAKQFALRGCEATALDVTWDRNVGLGRARALMEDAGVFFERVVGDGENLPFQPASFDLVFCSAALHHARDLSLLLQNVARVLKSGGRLTAILEPSLAVIDDEATELARDGRSELAVGINETRPTYDDYLAALRQAHLWPRMLVPAPSLEMDDGAVLAWARDLGAVWARPDWRAPERTLRRMWAFGSKRVRAMMKGRLAAASRVTGADERERALEAVGRWCMGEVFLVGEKGIGD